MDDVPDGREDDVTRTDVPVTRPEPSGPATDRVRIVGAEPAGESTSELPAVPGGVEPEPDAEPVEPTKPAEPAEPATAYGPGQPTVRLTDQPGDPGDAGSVVNPVVPGETAVPAGTAAATELPHWTEPPTGQVPAVLARDSGGEATGPPVVAPTWREEDADWVAHEEEFEPAAYGSDQVALGSLDETDSSDLERRPWEFNLDSVKPGSPSPPREHDPDPAVAVAGTRSGDDPITEPTEVVATAPDAYSSSGSSGAGGAPTESGRTASSGSGAASAAGVGAASFAARDDEGTRPMAKEPVPSPIDGDPSEPDPADAGRSRPTGSARQGRVRRNGLRPARMRAKKPEDVDVPSSPPLAAEPPGASVTDVPGAGRKRVGLASLAAADQSTADTVVEGEAAGGSGSGGVLTTAAAATSSGRGHGWLSRHSASDRPTVAPGAPGAPGGREPTGGGPPAPGRLRRPVAEGDQGGRGPHEDAGPIGVRVGTGVAVAVIALLAFKLGTVTSLVLTVVVVTFAAGECFGVLRRAGYHPATLLGLVGTISLMVGAYSKGVAALPLVLVLITVFTLVWYLFGIERGSPVAGTAATLLTVGWVSLLGAYAGLLLSPSTFPNRHGIAFLLGAIIATVANDVGALVIGGWLGSRPLAPTISPNKTWEGLFGGAVFSILVSTVVVGSIHPWSASNAALLGVVVAVVAPIGDLCESLLKRDLRLKDMGTLLPGHGGVLDRVDALLFVLPATYYLVRALNIA
ncbi:MAG TPA: phosphatidate cytidylyltransferase [Acidimicrobiales bacterium]